MQLRIPLAAAFLCALCGLVLMAPVSQDVARVAAHVHEDLGVNLNRSAVTGIPDCLHDPTLWHGVVERNADNSIACAYGHEHHDDPRVLDSVFGPLSYGEISYPWQTHSQLGPENVAKHRVYVWSTMVNQPCVPANVPLGVTNARLQAHADGNRGAAVRYHSFFLQAEGCDPANPGWRGTLSVGGHMDYGVLTLLMPSGSEVHVPMPGDPTPPGADRRIHGSTDRGRPDATWYGNHGIVGVGLRGEDWGPVDPNDPTRLLFYGNTRNGSWQEPFHLLTIKIAAQLDPLDGAMDGYVTFNGFTDRYGTIVSTCSPIGADCIPLTVNNMKVGSYQIRADKLGLATREYDVQLNGNSLIQHPDMLTNCPARPSVTVSTAPNGPNKIRATATVNTDSGTQSNVLQSIRFGAAENAVIDVGSQVGAIGNFTFTPAPYARQVSFDVRPLAPGPVHVPLVAVDICGDWPSFVAGGTAVLGSLSGFVRSADASKQAVTSASVVVRGEAYSTTTDSHGSFNLTDLPLGDQTIEVSARGFLTAIVPVNLTESSLMLNLELVPIESFQESRAYPVLVLAGNRDTRQAVRDPEPRKSTIEQSQQTFRTNASDPDNWKTEGSVVNSDCESTPRSVQIRTRDGLITVNLVGGTAIEPCRTDLVGRYGQFRGVEMNDRLFEAELATFS
ncbi:MAG: carboxypeptidase-like regulatory domain-containing protein [Chloroflexota bacterium]